MRETKDKKLDEKLRKKCGGAIGKMKDEVKIGPGTLKAFHYIPDRWSL
jgi:hypothetical protein